MLRKHVNSTPKKKMESWTFTVGRAVVSFEGNEMSPGASLLVDGEDILMRPPVAAPGAAAAASFGQLTLKTGPTPRKNR